MKKVVAFVSALFAGAFCLGTMASCDNRPTITVGYTDYPPMNYTDNNNNFVGFDTDLAKKVFGDLGYRVRFKEIEWTNKYTELNSGTIDCIWNGFTSNSTDNIDGVDTQRSDLVDFSYNYMINNQCVVRHANQPEALTAADFAGYTVAYEAGSAAESYVTEAKKTINFVNKDVTSQMLALTEVKAATAQYAVVDMLLAESIVGQSEWANVVINASITIPEEFYAIGFKKNSELKAKVNEKLVEYAESGYLMDLATTYNLQYRVIVDFTDQMN